MADHLPTKRTDSRANLTPFVTLSESVSSQGSGNIKRDTAELKKERKMERGTNTSRGDSVKPLSGSKEAAQFRIPSENTVPASGLAPPRVKIEQSKRHVDEWFERNKTMIMTGTGKGADSESMVSTDSGVLRARLKPDVGVWRVFRRFSEKGLPRPKVHFSPPTVKANPPLGPDLNDCVYDKPSQKLRLTSQILNHVNTRKRARLDGKVWQIDRLLRAGKALKLSLHHNISLPEAIRILKRKSQRQAQEYMMSGGRSPAPSPEASPEASPETESSQSLTVGASVSLTSSEVLRVLKALEADRSDILSPASRAPSSGSETLSSRASILNAGSLLESQRRTEEDEESHQATLGTPATSPTARRSSASVSRRVHDSPDQDPQIPSPVRRAASVSNEAVTEWLRGHPGLYGAQRQGQPHRPRRDDGSPLRSRGVPETRVSEAVLERRYQTRRRSARGTEKYRQEERQRMWDRERE